jgi:hypothetical protein
VRGQSPLIDPPLRGRAVAPRVSRRERLHPESDELGVALGARGGKGFSRSDRILNGMTAGPLPGSSTCSEEPADVPAWLRAHVGEGEGQIAQVVLRRARALYLEKVGGAAVKNSCYFAMDATRPSALGNGNLGRRFYVICETDRSFRAISAGYGGGRNLNGIANFANGRRCAKNFSNAMDSMLTTGGAYMTGEEITSFKGYYRASAGRDAALIRSFVQFDGKGDTANARQREIGGHPAVLLRGVCLRKKPDSPYADHDGYVPFGMLENYTDGRSNGCTSWSPSDAEQIIPMLKDKSTTHYIYPESADIAAIAQAVKAGRSPSRAGLYWNASCLREIGSPKFWPKETLVADPRSIREGSSGTAAAANSDLQIARAPCLPLTRSGHY